jgi:multiple sugar transport system ATP-binding protein
LAIVKLFNVTKRFGTYTAVKDLTLKISDGEFTVLVGPSGCGKTTTLRMIAGLETITEGEIRIDGRVVNKVPPKNRDIAMVFQNYALYPHMNVFNNMAFGLAMRRISKSEIKRRVNRTALLLGIEDKLKHRPKALSGGQRQRVALGRAIVRDPKVFLFDEPLSNLDAKLRIQMRTELIHLHRKLRTTTIYVTHDQVEAMTLGDKIAIMKEGEVQQYASPKETYDHPFNMFVAGFIGSPTMNFLPAKATVIKNCWHLKSEGFDLCLPPARARPLPQNVITGIRPEDLKVTVNNTDNIITLRVSVTEHIGSALIVHGYCGKTELVASLEPHQKVEPDTQIRLSANSKALHIFDPKTERSLLY